MKDIGSSLITDPKRFWGYIKSQRREALGIPPLTHGNKLCADDKEKAEALSQQFSSVFTRDDGSAIPDKGHSQYSSIDDLTVSPEGVLKQLRELKINKSNGPDEIPAIILHDYAEELTPALTHIFQQSYNSGELPTDWKKGRVSAIFKSGINPSNYRPVSLTSICCKVFEHIILSHTSKHLARHNILIDNQHGFRQKLSCETQLIQAVDDWAKNINSKHQTDVIMLDFSKAFDRVDHKKLLYKLDFYGIRGNTHQWIEGFLTGRSQVVSVNGYQSSPADVLSGVPQCSVLGPVVFLLFINDIGEGINSTFRLFADNCVLYRCIESSQDQLILQEDLQKMNQWAESWRMMFNAKKCYHLTITLKIKPLLHTYNIKDQEIARVKTAKYLGVIISEDLSWNIHIQQVRAKSSRTLGLVRRTLGSCNQQVKEVAYNQLIRPQLEYASCVWNPWTERNVQMVENIQRQAARFVMRDYRGSPVLPAC